MKALSIEEINTIINGEIVGETTQLITGLEQISKANNTQATFIGNRKYAALWPDSKAALGIINDTLDVQPGDNRVLIKVKNADLAMAKLLEAFTPQAPHFETDIHPAAVVDATAIIGEGSRVGAGCYIGKDVVIGKNVTLYPNVTIFDETTIGDYTTVWSGTIIRERSVIGSHCIFHNNVSIGADGFGFVPQEGEELKKVPQVGNVIIEDNVEIGSNTTIDRATLGSTVIKKGAKIDNLIQIAHNVEIGSRTVVAAQSGISGSTKVGSNCVIAGQVGIAGHLQIGDNVKIAAQSGLGANVNDNEIIQGSPAYNVREYQKSYIYFKRLPETEIRISKLEKEIFELKELLKLKVK
jgi:UDP-3-O-[3-hydroxymyristoyl] glucosamine N-acyltransferase